MRILILTIILALFSVGLKPPVPLAPVDYYVDFTGGNDANDGLTTGTAWKTIAKVNSMQASLPAHYRILFKGGEVWDGAQSFPLIPNKSGTSVNRNTYGSYGTGKPILSGFVQITGWTQIGATRVFESDVINAGALNGAATPTTFKIHMLTIDGAATPLGRYPNRTDPENDATTLDNNDGYLTVNSMPSYPTTSTNYRRVIYDTDPRLDSANWVGCRCALKNSNYTIDTATITHQGPDSLRIGKNTYYAQGANYGYFIYDCPQTLNKHGEWFYDRATKKIKMYIDAGHTPAEYVIKASVQNTLIRLENDTYLDFDNLFMEGSNANMIESVGGVVNNINFYSPSMYNSGSKGFDATGSSTSAQTRIAFYDVDVYMMYDIGFDLKGMGNNQTVYRGKIRASGTIPGTFGNEPGHSYGVIINSGNGHIVRRLEVDSSGYVGIRVTNSSSSITDSNWVHRFNLILDDGGGIYCSYQQDSITRYTNIAVNDNIVEDGYGTRYGAAPGHIPFANGLYADDNGHNITFLRNSVARVSRYALILHHTWDCTVRNNTFVEFGNIGIFYQKNDSNQHNLERHTVVGNIIVSPRRVDANTIMVWNVGVATNKADKSNLKTIYDCFTKLDSNYYGRPNTDPTNSTNTSTTAGTWFRHLNHKIPHLQGGKNYTLKQIQDTFGLDLNARVQPITRLGATYESFTKYFSNPTMDSVLYPLDSAYVDMKGNRYGPPGVKVAPYQSVFLLATGEPPPAGDNVAPIANAGSDQGVQLPFTSSVTLNPTDDAYTRFSTPTTVYNIDTLVIKKNTSNSFTRNSYLKFNLSAISNIQSATLRLYGRNTEDNITQTPQIRKTTDIWLESSLTWNNMPVSGEWIANLSFNATSAWSTADMTTYAQQEFSGDKLLSIAVLDTLAQNKNISIHSRQGTNKPELVIVSNGVLQLNGENSSDQDGTISYSWQKLSGPAGGDLSATNVARPTINNLQSGTYIYRLTVTDDDGATATDDVNVSVSSSVPNVAPTGTIVPSATTITLPTNSLTLNSTGSADSDGTIVSYLWTKVSGGAATITTPSASSTTITGLVAGSYIFRLRVTDDDGAFDEEEVSVTVNPQPVTPGKKGGKNGSKMLGSGTGKVTGF
jgi:hypothetical protein